jgi:hypothetical protein
VAHPAFLQQAQVEQAALRLTTLDSFRKDFLVLPARLVRESKRNIVKLPHDYHYQRAFLEASNKVDRLRLRRNF